MSATDYLTDALTSHQIYLQRYAGKSANAIDDKLGGLYNVINERLSLKDKFTVADLVGIRAQINGLIRQAAIGEEIYNIANELPGYEAEFFGNLLDSATNEQVNYLSPEFIGEVIRNDPILLTSTTGVVSRLTVEQIVNKFNATLSKDLINIFTNGVLNGESIEEIVSKIRKLVTDKSRREARTITRTIVNHISSVARQKVAEANRHIIKREKYVATLDNRTTILCASLDGKQFPVGIGPMPPLHYNCRSIRVPVTNLGLPGLTGERPFVSGKTRGVVPGDTKYESWLRRQPKSFIEDVLGKKRADLFINQKYSLDKFVDANYRVINLDELRRADNSMVDNLRQVR